MEREVVFEGKDCVTEFLKWILEYKKTSSRVVCLAHNSKSYDSQFVMNHILQIPNNDIQVVLQGYKILKIELKRYISFIDSIMFLQMPLASFPETFDLDENLTKGFFPYLFLSFDNYNYIGSIPSKKHFGFDVESSRKEEFDIWYEKQNKRICTKKIDMDALCRSVCMSFSTKCMNGCYP